MRALKVFALVALGTVMGSSAMAVYLTGGDEATEQIAALKYLRIQSKHWDQPGVDGGMQWPNWRASAEVALPELTTPVSEQELLADLALWESLERCATNGVKPPPSGFGESRPRSLTPEAAARFVRAVHGDQSCRPCPPPLR